MGSVIVNVEQRPSIGKSKTCNTTTYLNELSQNESLVAPLGFDQLEDNVSLPQVVEVMQDTQRNERSPCESEKAKKVRGPNMFKNVAALKAGEKLSVTFITIELLEHIMLHLQYT